MAKVNDVAKYILDVRNEDSMTTTQMSNLLYAVQGHYLVWTDRSLFKDDLVAYDNSIICETLRKYERHRGVTEKKYLRGKTSRLTSRDKELIVDVITDERYSISPYDLSYNVRHEYPYVKAILKYRKKGERAVITKKSMKDYYGLYVQKPTLD